METSLGLSIDAHGVARHVALAEKDDLDELWRYLDQQARAIAYVRQRMMIRYTEIVAQSLKTRMNTAFIAHENPHFPTKIVTAWEAEEGP